MTNSQEFVTAVYRAVIDPEKDPVSIGTSAVMAYAQLNEPFRPDKLPDTIASRIVIEHFDTIKDAYEHIRDAKPKLYSHQIRDIYHYVGYALLRSAVQYQ